MTVRIGLSWLAAGGHVALTEEGNSINLAEGDGEVNQYAQKELFIALKGLLEETAAYRSYVANTPDLSGLFD
jgi:hypothetical protein